MEGEDGQQWQAVLSEYIRPDTGSVQHVLRTGWPAVAAALQLEAVQAVYLAVPGPSRLLISRRGEPHFHAAAAAPVTDRALAPAPTALHVRQLARNMPGMSCQ